MSNGAIKTVNELHIYIDGKFDMLRTEIRNIRKVTFWMGGLAGGIVTGIVVGLFKLVGWIK